jgi:hypothetical protein
LSLWIAGWSCSWVPLHTKVQITMSQFRLTLIKKRNED